MALRNIEQVSCSLNAGLIYSVDYNYSPKEGVAFTIFFVKESGQYQKPAYLQKAFIRLGSATFSLNVVASKISLASGRRVMEVTFVDDSYKLDNYLVVLTGRGCGYNVYQLGVPVDRRTPAQKQAAALDSAAEQISEFTEFQDLEYGFDAFLTILRAKFSVSITANYDRTITNSYTGTFRDVLEAWCSLFNFSYFFENSTIKIFDPTKLTITLPSQPTDALSYEDEEDVRDTYGKTVFNWFQQDGGQFSLNQTSNSDGSLFVRTDTLYPVGYEFNLPQVSVDLNQVAAAQYGQEFWFLYNYYKGSTATNCGWTPTTFASNLSIVQSMASRGSSIARVDQTIADGKFQAFQQYGSNIAGRWYLSNEKSTLAVDQNYTWFDESEGAIFNFDDVDTKAMNLKWETPVSQTTQALPETVINNYYPGVNYVGNRIFYQDTTPLATGTFSLTTAQTNLVNSTFQSLYDVKGSSSMDFNTDLTTPNGGPATYVAYTPITILAGSTLGGLFDAIPTKTSVFAPRFTSIPIKGIASEDYASLKASQNEPDGVEVVTTTGPSVVSNTAVIKTLKQGAYTIYYDKYSKCASSDSNGNYFQHRFDPRQISVDNQIGFTFTKQANNTYLLQRDYSFLNALVANPLLPTLAQPRSFVTRRISYTVNYFKDIPTNFLTNGLVGMSVSVAGDGVTASYTFSNEVLQVPYPEDRFLKYEQQIRNSWIRQYSPNQVIS